MYNYFCTCKCTHVKVQWSSFPFVLKDYVLVSYEQNIKMFTWIKLCLFRKSKPFLPRKNLHSVLRYNVKADTKICSTQTDFNTPFNF